MKFILLWYNTYTPHTHIYTVDPHLTGTYADKCNINSSIFLLIVWDCLLFEFQLMESLLYKGFDENVKFIQG